MKILLLQLKGFKRLLLNAINYIEIRPESKIQLILGSNGSGKSSLMTQLTPLPAIPQEYEKDGYKVIEISHNNSYYILKSIFSSTGNKFHFIKDGEELNPGGTTSTYKELVKKEFNVTLEVHELLIGVTNFHSMTVSERRNWFTKIADADYSYAIQYYNKLKEQHRDIQGAIKTIQTRLVQESEKLLKPEQEVSIREEIKFFQGFLENILELKTPMYLTRNDSLQAFSKKDELLLEKSKRILTLRGIFLNYERFQSVEDIDNRIIYHQALVQSQETEFTKLCESIDSRQKTIESLKNANIDSVKDIDKTIDSLVIKISESKQKFHTEIKFDNPKSSLDAICSVYADLSDICIKLSENKDRRYSRDNYLKYADTVKATTTLVNNLKVNHQNLLNKKSDLEHLRDHGSIECPKCKHSWIQGFTVEKYKEVIESIENSSKTIIVTEKNLEQHTSTLNDCISYLEQYRSFINITKAWSQLNSLWSFLIDSGTIFDNPRNIAMILEDVKSDISLSIEILKFENELKSLIELKELTSKTSELNIKNTLEEIEKDNLQVLHLQNQIQYSKFLISKYTTYKKISYSLEQITDEIEYLIKDHEKDVDSLLSIYKNEYYNDIINEVKLQLGSREQIISKIDVQKALVDNLQKQIIEFTEKEELLKLAVKELSPSEGLIAKSLIGFINHFVQKMNLFIRKVWSYPLELIPIQNGEDSGVDLDFKFSLLINGNMPVADISKGSSAMKEIIDLAFKVASMPYLHLHDAPLFLDEFGAKLDSAHRSSIYNIIMTLCNSSNFSQIFIISHFEEVYGSFKNTDITMLCNANMPASLQSGFNKHVVIK